MRSHGRFSLIEMLVVVAILAILMSMLLPQLNRMTYQANLLQCSNNLKNISQGIMLYADDNSDYCPNSGERQMVHRLSHDEPGYDYNLRPLMLPYYTNCFDSIFICPMSAPFFTEGIGKTPSDGNDSPEQFQARISVPYQMLFGPITENSRLFRDFTPMMRVGDTFEVYGNRYDILVSDMVSRDRWQPLTVSTHYDPKGDSYEWGSMTNSTYFWMSPYGSIDANFLLGDGSVKLFQGFGFSDATSSLELNKTGHWENAGLLPAELSR